IPSSRVRTDRIPVETSGARSRATPNPSGSSEKRREEAPSRFKVARHCTEYARGLVGFTCRASNLFTCPFSQRPGDVNLLDRAPDRLSSTSDRFAPAASVLTPGPDTLLTDAGRQLTDADRLLS